MQDKGNGRRMILKDDPESADIGLVARKCQQIYFDLSADVEQLPKVPRTSKAGDAILSETLADKDR